MHIVIDISEEEYNIAKYGQYGNINIDIVRKAIAKGTLLPKGHGRLGDLDALRNEVSSWGMNDYEPSDFTDEIDETPTIIPADEKTVPTEEKIDKAIKEIKDNRAEIACLFDDDWDRGIEAILEILNKLK